MNQIVNTKFQEHSTPRIHSIDILNHKFLDRLIPLPTPTCKIEYHEPAFFLEGFVKKVLSVDWPPSKPFNGGKFVLRFADQYSMEGYAVGENPRFIASYVETNRDPIWPGYRNPQESMTAFISLIATLNEFSLSQFEGLTHVAEANKLSNPIFERLNQIGMYSYCDGKGQPTNSPITTDHGILYSCHYPIPELRQTTEKFVLPSVVDYIGKLK